jgi:UPF0755 protein
MIFNLRKKLLIVLLAPILISLVAGGIFGYWFWSSVFKNNVNPVKGEVAYLFIATGSNFEDLKSNILKSNLLKNTNSFFWVANRKNLASHVKPGRYEIKAGMSNNEIVNLLRSGKQKPLNVIFNNIRTSGQLAGNIAQQIEADSVSIINLLKNNEFLKKHNLNTETARIIFIPNTYQFYWNTDVKQFFNRMLSEYQKFWTEQRKQKAKSLGMSLAEVSILASIVDKETNQNDEKPRIAGVYINRLHDNWKLQADPTVVYAVGNFEMKRVLNVHLEIDSPYNTYKYAGLPPGPICLPTIAGIDAVLYAEKHDYYYFVARPDGSGYHNFAKTYNQHLNFARQFHKYLNERKIKN